MDEPSSDRGKTPAATPPPGVTPNFVNPPTQAPMLNTGIYVMLPLMLLFFSARIYTRTYITRALGTDDYLCIIATAATLAYAGVLVGMLNLKPFTPLGRHQWDIPVAALSNEYLKLVILALVTFPIAAMLVKVTILALYRRLFRPSKWAHRLIWIGIILVLVFYITTIIILLAFCLPSRGVPWIVRVQSGASPTVQVNIALSQGVFGLVIDLYILAIPIWQVSRLSLPPQRKAGILLIFLTGLLAVASSAGGLATRAQVTLEDPNFLTSPYLFGLLEVSIALICSCMPIITMPLKSLLAQTISSWNSAKKFSRSLISRLDKKEPNKHEEQLPRIPGGTLSGLRTFIRKLHASTPTSIPTIEFTNFEILTSETDQDYHEHLRGLQGYDVERLAVRDLHNQRETR
ncbi:hypothetical protein FHL15_005392 [Xylaria flabelliformis]|uniref:Rhodopsin domain-containing protein n=1 Tax=Xylaria flabelliformis TaxID=2512241 RepID=A0A553I0J2_9PEZI|nr:hypothetical protein FHL15_005392 [Xylaria flabelliformis]